MICTEQKPFKEIEASLRGYDKIFIFGCGSCATAWHTGGEEEVKEMAAKLEAEAGKIITGWTVVEEDCDERKVKKEYRAHAKDIDDADAMLVMSCGSGVQTVALALNRPSIPALNSLYLARLQTLKLTDERCILCGSCVLAYTGGVCPVTICPKSLLNGPCGGYDRNGNCEVDPTRRCAWVQIYERMEQFGELDKLEWPSKPKNYGKMNHPRKVDKNALGIK